MTAICSIGGIVLDSNLRCPALHHPPSTTATTLFFGGGKQVLSSPVLPDFELIAGRSGGAISGYYTYSQILSLRALPDLVPQPFRHPTADELGLSDLLVLIDKSTLTPTSLTCVHDLRGFGWPVNPPAEMLLTGSIKLIRVQ